MLIRGSLYGVTKDWKKGQYLIAFRVEDGNVEDIQNYLNKIVLINIDDESKPKTIKANAYFWQLITKLAQSVGTTKDLMYLEILSRYTAPVEHIEIKRCEAKQILRVLGLSYAVVKQVGEYRKGHFYYCEYEVYKGVSTFSSKEFARLIDSVIQECKEAGIETLPPGEIERLKSSWKA